MTEAAGLSLSLHVLDAARGQAGAGLAFSLSRVEETGARSLLAEGETDTAGRWAMDAALTEGLYEFVFAAGAYQARSGAASFYDLIPIRFRMERGGGRYHIPLILSPFGYSTYRGG